MKVLSRDFSVKEKILILVLVLFLVGLAYYQFFLVPTNKSIEKAVAEKQALDDEYLIVQAKVSQLQKMQDELDELIASGQMKYMPSYNNGKKVRKLLNDVLGNLGYSITFSRNSRNGDQVRRNLTLQFDADSYDTVRRVLDELVNSEFRCMISDLNCSRYRRSGTVLDPTVELTDNYSVSATITFYETMVGGVPDVDLPQDSSTVH